MWDQGAQIKLCRLSTVYCNQRARSLTQYILCQPQPIGIVHDCCKPWVGYYLRFTGERKHSEIHACGVGITWLTAWCLFSLQNSPGSTTDPSESRAFRYSVKLISFKRKSNYMVLGVSFGRQFSDPEEIRDELHKEHPDKISWAMKEVGYIQLGHSCKGKQCWIVSERDIEKMYKDHKGAREILLWCYSKDDNDVTLLSKLPWVSASSASSSASKTSQAESIAQKLTEVDEIDSGLSWKAL